jgi:hypothetical protein
MTIGNNISKGYINIVDKDVHKGRLTSLNLERHSENFAKPVLFRGLVNIDPKLPTREFFDRLDPSKTLQWRVKSGDKSVSMRSPDGSSDYNYVTGKVGTGAEFLDDIFVRELDVYSHLGTISSGYNDPYPWGKEAFNLVKDNIFSSDWFSVDNWKVSGHMFVGRSNRDFGEPRNGAVGSDWHMFPTLNIFVMIAGQKKWMTRPPKQGEQYRDYDKMFSTSSGREAPGEDFECDVVYVEPGDVLLNLPFEWHKVLNAKGFSLGAAFRVIDTDYLAGLSARKTLDTDRVNINADMAEKEELAHFLTSISYASRHINRAQMILNDVEYAYLRRRKGAVDSVNIGHL